jgi:hypothetical protein
MVSLLIGPGRSTELIGHDRQARRAGAESLESVEDEVETERELDIVVASAEDALVTDRLRKLADAWVSSQSPRHSGCHLG